MTNSKLAVIGSSNRDLVVRTKNFPKAGETVPGHGFEVFPGGKGANQAVAAARIGSEVYFIARIGDDLFGKQMIESLKADGIKTEGVVIDMETPSGVATITLNEEGENQIVVAGGSNMKLSPRDISNKMNLLEQSDFWLTQCEIPLETVVSLYEQSVARDKNLILNPAPATDIPKSILNGLYMITPNQTEAFSLTGVEVTDSSTAQAAAFHLMASGVKNVIITMGGEGAFFTDGQKEFIAPAPVVDVLDTTGAGDTFNGVLASLLARGENIESAVNKAVNAAAFSVTKTGAQTGAPTFSELEEFSSGIESQV